MVFVGQGTSDIAAGVNSKAARKACLSELHAAARRKLLFIAATRNLGAIAALPGSRFERLVAERKGQYSIRINDRFRICFDWSDQGADAIEIVDYH
jgi:proteic killer suppression protein